MTKYPVFLLVTLNDDTQVSRLVDMPFPPFPGLRVSDDTFGEVKIAEVLWDEDDEDGIAFHCPAEPFFKDKKLENVIRGKWVDVTVRDCVTLDSPEKKLCPECNGTGEAPNPFFSCQYCKDDDGESTGSYEDYRRKRDRLED